MDWTPDCHDSWTDEGLHLHGYVTKPTSRPLTNGRRYSLLEVDRPAREVDSARVSLTVSETSRLHFDSTEGVVRFVDASLANHRSEPIEMDLRVATADGSVRVDDTFSIAGTTTWSNVGYAGFAGTEFVVDVAVERLGIDVGKTYRANDPFLRVAVRDDGNVAVGSPTET